MFRNITPDNSAYAMRQRMDTPARIAPSAMNGNRYRSWTRVGSMKNAIDRIVTPTRITSGVGRRATTRQTARNASAMSAAPMNTAGTGPNMTASGHETRAAVGTTSVSHAQTPFAATPLPPTDARAHGFHAPTLTYG